MKRLVIDTETTGLYPNYHQTLTVGLLLVDVEKDFLDILDENHIFIKHPQYNTMAKAMKITGIDLNEQDKIAIPPSKACNQINKFVRKNSLRETPIVGHNFHFDRGFLSALFDQGESISHLSTEHEDTMWIWRNLQRAGHVPSHLRSTLQTLADFFKIDYTRAHDALADCKITAKVYRELLRLKA